MSRFGSIGEQYFDNAGKPLINGFLHFNHSGDSNTQKDTFADINEQIPNDNPVPLTAAGRQPDIFFTGFAQCILATSSGVQIEVRDPVGGDATGGQWEQWNGAYTYDGSAIVIGPDSKYYRSLAENNQGNSPDTSPAFWEEYFVESYTPIKPYSETLQALPADDIDLSGGNYFTKTLSGNTVFTFSNAPAGAAFLTLRVKGALAGGYSVAWPAEVTAWGDGATPALGDDNLVVFVTEDSGTTYYGVHVGEVSAP